MGQSKPKIEERRKSRCEYYLARKREFLEAKAKGKNPKSKDFQSANPWHIHYSCAKKRCECPTQVNYKYYGGKGIKFELSVQDVKDLWIRDNAVNMTRPSLDREDSNKNYCWENCRFIELSENCSRANLGKKRKRRT